MDKKTTEQYRVAQRTILLNQIEDINKSPEFAGRDWDVEQIRHMPLPNDMIELILNLMLCNTAHYLIKLARVDWEAKRPSEETGAMNELIRMFDNEEFRTRTGRTGIRGWASIKELGDYHRRIIRTIPEGLGHFKLRTASELQPQ